MPNIKSAKKRAEVSIRNKEVNQSNKSELNTCLKNLNKAVLDGDKALAQAKLNEAFKLIDENVTKGTIHKNKANRKKANASKLVNNMQ